MCTKAEKDSLETIQHEADLLPLTTYITKSDGSHLLKEEPTKNLFTLLIVLTDWHQPIYVQFIRMPLAIVHITLFGMH